MCQLLKRQNPSTNKQKKQDSCCRKESASRDPMLTSPKLHKTKMAIRIMQQN